MIFGSQGRLSVIVRSFWGLDCGEYQKLRRIKYENVDQAGSKKARHGYLSTLDNGHVPSVCRHGVRYHQSHLSLEVFENNL